MTIGLLEFAVEEHGVQVRDVVRHRVDAGMRALAVAAQVVGDDPVVGGQGLGDRREREREVLDAVRQQDRGARGADPTRRSRVRCRWPRCVARRWVAVGSNRCGRLGCGQGQGGATSRKPLSASVRFSSASGPARVALKRSSCSPSSFAEHPPHRGLLIRGPGVGLADRARQVGESGVEPARPAQGVLAGAGHPEVEELPLGRPELLAAAMPAWLVALEDVAMSPPLSDQAIFQLPQVAAETLGFVDDRGRLVRCRRGSGRAGRAGPPGRLGDAVESGSSRRSMSTVDDRLAVTSVSSPSFGREDQFEQVVAPERRQHRESAAVGQRPPAPPRASPSRAARLASSAAGPRPSGSWRRSQVTRWRPAAAGRSSSVRIRLPSTSRTWIV